MTKNSSKNAENYVTGGTLSPNAGIKAWYNKELEKLCKPMIAATSKAVLRIYKQNENDVSLAQDSLGTEERDVIRELKRAFAIEFNKKGAYLAKKMVLRSLRNGKWAFNSAMRKAIKDENILALKGKAISREMADIIRLSVAENVSLIKSIPEQYFNNITSSVVRAAQAGNDYQQLKEQILKTGASTKKRASMIADDQISKVNTAIQLCNFEEGGVKQFKWVHTSAGMTYRKHHKDSVNSGGLNGGIFDIDKPPVINESTGATGFPGQEVNCHCLMAIVLPKF